MIRLYPGQYPGLPEEAIERDADTLLAEYARARGVVIEPPIPIEDIIEKHLKLGIEFDDMHRLFDEPRGPFARNILGAITFKKHRIIIDESLDPEVNPWMEGDYRLTLGHEVGHQRLHGHFFAKGRRRTVVVDARVVEICSREDLEGQADLHA